MVAHVRSAYSSLPRWRLALLLLPFLAHPLCAGGGPFNTLVVVNTNSADSVELGEYYAETHGIPAHHLCSIGVTTNWGSITSNEFHSQIWAPVTNHIATNGLAGQIDFLVLCQDLPTRVEDVEGVTAALFYGFKDAPGHWDPPAGVCKLPAGTSNNYNRAERAFNSSAGWNATNGFIAFHLISSNLATSKLVADRGAAAQSTFPATASIYLYNLGDGPRGWREQRFANAQFAFAALPGLPAAGVIAPNWWTLSGKTNVMGYHDGYGNLTGGAKSTNNTWLAGAYADHMTSCGGMLPTPCYSQDTVLNWMGVGATASYGTVAEPCAYLEKFPDPLLGFYYARGFSLGEAYAMSVEAPYQGLFAGDPLAAPFAAPPVITVSTPAPYQIVTGGVPLQVSAAARSNGVPAAALDLYADGRFAANLATLGPAPGNVLSVGVAGRTNSASVATNDSLFAAVSNLAAAVNADSNQIVAATAAGDRLELVYKNFDHGGDNAAVTAAVAQGPAAALTLGTGLAATNLVPATYPARKMVWLEAHTASGANSNDALICVITLTNGAVSSNKIVAAQSEAVTSILGRLGTALNADPVLLATNGAGYNNFSQYAVNYGYLVARTPGPDGRGIQVDYHVNAVSNTSGLTTNADFASFLEDNPDDVRPRASVLFHVRPANGILAAAAAWSTTNLADGLHTLDFVARDGSAVAAQSRLTVPVYVGNSSPQLELLGTNGAAVADGAAPDPAAGTDFGRLAWQQPRTNVFGLRNNGTAPLTITHWTTNGPAAAGFQITGIPAAIEAGGVSNFSVVFAPATAGVFQAALAIGSDALVPQTNLLFAGTHGRYLLAIESAHGNADPPAGVHTNWHGTGLTNALAVPAAAGGTQFVCTGWSMVGNEPANGSATNFTMTLTNDAALVWLWTTNYWLAAAAGPHGTVDVADAWQPAGATTQLTASADLYYHFTNWTGSVTGTNNPLALLMDAPQAVQANFAENLAASNTPEWWLALHGWTSDFDAAATRDAEPDGFFTWQEYIADTDPTNAASFPRLDLITTFGTNFPILDWTASSGRRYQVHRCDDLVDAVWLTQEVGLGTATWTDTNPPPPTNRYYRLAPRLP